MDHFTFAICKDMTFFSQDAVDQLHKYNPVNLTSEPSIFLN